MRMHGIILFIYFFFFFLVVVFWNGEKFSGMHNQIGFEKVFHLKVLLLLVSSALE